MSVSPLHDEEAVTDPDCTAEQSDSPICAAYKRTLRLKDVISNENTDLRSDQQASYPDVNVVQIHRRHKTESSVQFV